MDVISLREGFSERLNALLDEEKFPAKGSGRQTALAKAIGVSQKGARKWLESEGVPEMHRAISIAEKFDVCVEWLLTGRGQKRPGIAAEELDHLSALERRYRQASPETRALIELCLDLPYSVPLPESVTPTLRTLIENVRLLISGHLSAQ